MRVTYIFAVIALALAIVFGISAAESPVADAAMSGDMAGLRSLLQRNAGVNAPQTGGTTALHWAIYREDLPMVEALLAAGASVAAETREGATPMFLASEAGNAAILEMLLNAGADPDDAGMQSDTALMMAARTGNVAALRVLLDHGADVNAYERWRGTTALMWAAEQRQPEAVRYLIERGANIGATSGVASLANTAYLAPLVRTREVPAGAPAAGRPFIPPAGKGGAKGGAKNKGPAAAAPKQAKAKAPRNPLADLDIGIEQTGPLNGGVAIAFAGQQNTNGGQLSALHFAAREDCLECARLLLDAGADVNQTSRYGWSPLLTAIQNRHYQLASLLLDRGADPNIANHGGWSPLYIATDNRNIEGGDYPVRPADMDHLELIQLLLDHGADVNQRLCGIKSTPEACDGDSTETRTIFTMQWVQEHGATPFWRAAQSGDVVLMELLLAHGADPKIATEHNLTPLAVASGIGWVEGVTFEWSPEESVAAVRMLLDLGIDPNIANIEGRTALHGAAHKGRNEVVQLLVDAGADLNAHDLGSRDTGNGALFGHTWVPLNYAEGLVRVGVQSAIAHPETAELIRNLMNERGIPLPPPLEESICVTDICQGFLQ